VMNGMLWAVVGAGIGVLAPFLILFWRRRAADAGDSLPTAVAPRRRAATPSAPAKAHGPAKPSGGVKRKLALKFHGVSLRPGPHACQAVQALAGQRFLPQEAPAMPLATCDQQKCQCAFSHHRDRRDQDDRRSGWGTFGGFMPTVPGGNRRGKSRDRRGTA
jgi:hypothetical protein